MGSTRPPSTLLDDDDPSLFPKLTDQQVALLAPLGKIRSTSAAEVLFREGDVTYDALVLLEGRVSVVLGTGDAMRELVVQRPRDLMVEFNILTGEPVGATGIVREAGSVLEIPAHDFRMLLGRESIFGDFILQTMFRRRRAIERFQLGIHIVGSRFDRDTHRLREFAARNRVLHDWLDTDDAEGAAVPPELAADARHKPVVIMRNGQPLRNPTDAELARALGLSKSGDRRQDIFDLVVIGAGPAGLAAAVYGASGGLRTAVLDAIAVGGQAGTAATIENYLGFPAGLSGADLAERARLQAIKFGADIMVPRRAVGLIDREGVHVVLLEDSGEVLARSVILALGVQYRRLPIDGLAKYEGLGVAYAVDSAREQRRASDNVVVVGGASSAGQAVLAFANEAPQVHLVVRADRLEHSMARYLRDRIADTAIDVLLGYQVRELTGEAHLERVTVEHVASGERRTLDAGVMIVLIGAVPQTEWLTGAVALDTEGLVLTGPSLIPSITEAEPWTKLARAPFLLETSRPGVFAVGDVRSGSTRMVASAAGEGGMAVRFVAEHLARVS